MEGEAKNVDICSAKAVRNNAPGHGVDGISKDLLVWMIFLKVFDARRMELMDDDYPNCSEGALESGLQMRHHRRELLDFVNNKLFKELKEIWTKTATQGVYREAVLKILIII